MMIVDNEYVSCPKCGWEPGKGDIWVCDDCRTRWNTFETHAKCPGCGKQFIDTQCRNCKQMSLNSDWYKPVEEGRLLPRPAPGWFSSKKDDAPITESDRIWVEDELLWLTELFTPEVFRSLETITPESRYFDRKFTGTEEDADYILQKVAEYMAVKPWEIQLMFFSEEPTRFTEGITATPSDKLNGGWSAKGSDLVNNGYGQKEIWIELHQLRDPAALIATMSVELAMYKLMSEYDVENDVDVLADVTSLVFGFGIFRANAYFKFSQWQGNRYQGWNMSRRGGLPEPIIAYVMAWLAYYRGEDINWANFLNRTVKKYFDRSYAFIGQNFDSIKWSM